MGSISQTLQSFSRWSVAAFAAALLLFASASAGSSLSNIQSSVLEWSRANPGQPVPVIVQGAGGESLVSSVEEAGGRVERELRIIGAVDALVPAGNLASLAGDPAVQRISLDAPMVSTGFVDTSKLASAYPFAVNAPTVWNAETPATGRGVTVAVIDSGVTSAGNSDFQDEAGASRVTAEVSIDPAATSPADGYGHGTHIAGIVGGDGDLLSGKYIGIAPEASVINVKISDDVGGSTLADAIAGIQWVVENKETYNIRVMNLSLHSSVAESYKRDPLDAAVEFAWLRGIVVVVAAGNMGSAPDAVSYPPANDPFVITVGATDDMATSTRDDDAVAFFSSRGVTQDGFAKPEIVAPGRKIVSNIDPNSILAQTYPDRFEDRVYFRMSGTSMSAPVVSGIAALMLERNPALTPGQVKYILTNTAQPLPLDSSAKAALADQAAFYSGIPGSSDDGISPGKQVRMNFVAKIGAIAYVLGEPDPAAAAAAAGFDFSKIGPSGANLDNVSWEAIKWNAIKWDAIKWDAIKWDAIKWDAIKWDAIKWDAIKWDVIKWGAITWGAIKWDVIKWDAIKWNAIKWDAVVTTEITLTGLEFSSGEFDSATGFDSVGFAAFISDPALNGCERGRRDCSSIAMTDPTRGRGR